MKNVSRRLVPPEARSYAEDFDLLEKEYNNDIAEWLNELFLDVEYTIDSRGELKRACLLRTYGGPNVWVCLEGGDDVTVEIQEPFKELKKISFKHPAAREVFDYLYEYVREGLLCR